LNNQNSDPDKSIATGRVTVLLKDVLAQARFNQLAE
jgi:hypothetical protein